MSRIALYRKYRPRAFGALVGQPHVVQVLQGALKKELVGHAYLFAGPRGSGKTTTARIFAQAVNCQIGKSGESCGKCPACLVIQKGAAIDIIEIDAASNRGIDEIRSLRDGVRFTPTQLRYKVYIIDEVHMLTKEAFNALLKTLEEPPGHAIFILATTELNKVPVTIQSRVQRLQFRRATPQDLIAHLQTIAAEEQVNIDDEALQLVAISADGSFRDAISLFDQAATHSKGKITAAALKTLIGYPDLRAVEEFLAGIAQNEPQRALRVLAALETEGGDLHYFRSVLLEYVRTMLFLKLNVAAPTALSPQDRQKAAALAASFSAKQLLALVRFMLEAAEQSKLAGIASLGLEMVVWQAINLFDGKLAEAPLPSSSDTKPSVLEIKDKKEKIKDTNKKLHSIKDSSPETRKNPSSVRSLPAEAPTNGGAKEGPLSSDEWQAVRAAVKPLNHALYALLSDIQPKGIEGATLLLSARFAFHAERLNEPKKQQLLTQAAQSALGQTLTVKCLVEPARFTEPAKNVDGEELLKEAQEIFE